jgi:uncharacterized hydrophobic protein (TIGR00341 family)
MRHLQVTAPFDQKKKVKEVLDNHSNDISSKKAEMNDEKSIEFSLTADSDELDDITEELKGIKSIASGDLSIRVMEQESLIEKGQKTKGSAESLSQEEIYSKAQESAEFSKSEWGLVGLSSAIAAYGLALDNIIVVVGAMMLAPMLSPFVSGAFSLVVGDRTMMKSSLRYGAESALISVIVAFLAVVLFPVQINSTLELVVSPGLVSTLLSLLVGSAAALTFTTGLRDQVAGVAVAVALVPPLASVGIGLKMLNFGFAANAATVAVINILALIVSGYFTFRLLGFHPSTYYKKKEAEKIHFVVPLAMILITLFAFQIGYTTYTGYQGYISEYQVTETAEEYFGEDLVMTDVRRDEILVVVAGAHDLAEFESNFNGEKKVRVVELAKSG